MTESCQVCVELQRAGIDVPCSVCTPEEYLEYIERTTLEHTGMTTQEYERWMCGCPRCRANPLLDWFAGWRDRP